LRKFFAFMMTTVDGYYEGPGQEFDIWTLDDEFDTFAAEQLEEMDTLVLGRVTYEGMAGYWPTPAAAEDDPRITTLMNEIPKVVVSRSLDTAEWANTEIVRSADELRSRRRAPRAGRGDPAPRRPRGSG
jgi:dihydrofolate reductase